jgi:dTMP kinase
MKKGLFITFEGGEGSGKSTQAEILTNRLRLQGVRVVATREPGGTRIGEQVRSITHSQENIDLNPKAEAYLMAASRAQHVAEVIYPAIQAGMVVICDRFVDSSIAYQGYGRELGPDIVAGLNDFAVNGARPDMTILLDIDPEIGAARRNGSGKKDRLDLQEAEFYLRVRQGYLELAKKFPERYVVINAAGGMEKVAGQIWAVISKKFNLKNGSD